MKDKKIKILVMKFRNIGDVLLTTPLVENLRRIYPDAQIDFALNKGTEAMIEGNPNIQNIHIYDRANIKEVGFFKRLWRELKFIRAIKALRDVYRRGYGDHAPSRGQRCARDRAVWA